MVNGDDPRPEPLETTCPVISALSQMKQFANYPKCSKDCEWYDSNYSRCVVNTIALELREMRIDRKQARPWMGYTEKQELMTGARRLGTLIEKLIDEHVDTA